LNIFSANKTKSLTQDNHQAQSSSSSSQTPTTSRSTIIPYVLYKNLILLKSLFDRVTPTLQQDADLISRQSSQRSVLLFYDDEPDEIVNFFFYCTNLMQTDPSMITSTFQVLHVYGNGANEERILKKTLAKALTNVNSFHFVSNLI
jgi:hypothetical protein